MSVIEDIIIEKLNVEQFLIKEHGYRMTKRRRGGTELNGHCPLPNHKDKNASFSVNKNNGRWNCFGCGKGGKNIISLIQAINGWRQDQTIEYFKNKLNIEVSEFEYVNKILKKLDDGEEVEKVEEKEFYEIYLDRPYFRPATEFLDIVTKRVDKWMIEQWNLLYVNSGHYKGRLIIPIIWDGKIISFVARDLTSRSERWQKIYAKLIKEDTPIEDIKIKQHKFGCSKVLYPEGTPINKIFFNFDEAKKQKTVFLVEGVFDCMRLVSYGYNAMAILGSRLSNFQYKEIVKNFEKVYICLDNDVKEDGRNPGQEAAQKILQNLEKFIYVKNVILPIGKDPDECTLDEFKQSLDICNKMF